MDRLPLSLNTRDALQLEQLILQADNIVLRQTMLLLKLRVDRLDTEEAEQALADMRQDATRLRAQRANIDTSLGWNVRAAE